MPVPNIAQVIREIQKHSTTDTMPKVVAGYLHSDGNFEEAIVDSGLNGREALRQLSSGLHDFALAFAKMTGQTIPK